MTSLSLGLGVAARSARASAAIAVSAPSGFSDFTRPTILRASGNIFSTNYNHAAEKPAYTQTIYVRNVANNTGDGLSFATAVRSIKSAISKANAFTGETVRLLIYGEKRYLSSVIVSSIEDGWAGFVPTVNLVIESGDGLPIYCIRNLLLPAFTQPFAGEPYYHSTHGSLVPTNTAADFANLDSDGVPIALSRVESVVDSADPRPELAAAAAADGRGAVYVDAALRRIWVRLFNDRAPDGDFYSLIASANGYINSAASRTLWMENVRFIGGDRALRVQGSGSTVNHTIRAQDCWFAHAHGDGFAHTDGGASTIVLNRARAKWNRADGITYKGANTSTATCPTALEIDCISDWNGWDGAGTNNGTTTHEYCRAIRVNGLYRNNADRQCHDVNSSQNWYLGCVAGPSRASAGVAKSGFVASLSDGGSELAKTWLDACSVGAGLSNDLYCYANAQLRYANMTIGSFTLGGTTANIQGYAA
ncbi:MAG: hypothetical protein NW203_15140 [Hyphomonadaceae bacterium]|nr:hypothetical protein [Hyphomonadaceae bacterium]